MDRSGVVTRSDRVGEGRRPSDAFVFPSRAEALALLETAVNIQEGPVLFTGESGMGKTWLCRKLLAEKPFPWRWVSVDLSPAIGATELYHLILHGMGLEAHGGPASARVRIEDALADAASNGERMGLIVDESHNASSAALEELRVLGNRMGEAGALGSLILVGQTPLVRLLATYPFRPVDARIAVRVHLRPISVDELQEWLSWFDRGRPRSEDEVEWLHRDLAGNPRSILLHSALNAETTVPAVKPSARPQQVRRVVDASVEAPAWEPPPVAPVKPPLEVGEEMIEVGWDANPEEPAVVASGATSERSQRVLAAPGHSEESVGASDEVIEDHYAALQAWSEWAVNQGRAPIVAVGPASDASEPAGPETQSDAPLDDEENEAVPGHPGVWAEGQHAFAPYSQLFSRLRQSRDSA
jgi:type II secretory pathway predicted ATPase ExeA